MGTNPMWKGGFHLGFRRACWQDRKCKAKAHLTFTYNQDHTKVIGKLWILKNDLYTDSNSEGLK